MNKIFLIIKFKDPLIYAGYIGLYIKNCPPLNWNWCNQIHAGLHGLACTDRTKCWCSHMHRLFWYTSSMLCRERTLTYCAMQRISSVRSHWLIENKTHWQMFPIANEVFSCTGSEIHLQYSIWSVSEWYSSAIDGVISDDTHHTEVLKVSSIQYILCCIELPVACTTALMYRHDISAKCRLD